MKVLWVFAHPEPRSLNGALRDEGIAALREHGHEVRESDLYAMGWNPVVEATDFHPGATGRLDVAAESMRAFEADQLSTDIRTEQDKIRWADTLIVQFPLWWFGPPAILKGWFDRVFVNGFAYGVHAQGRRWTRKYGDGGLIGRRAMVMVTVGARGSSIGPRGIHGDIDEVLFPLQHGTFWYSGMAVVPPFVVDGANRIGDEAYAGAAARLRERLLTLPSTEPLPFRHQDLGDYGDDLALRPDLAPGESGLGVHYARRAS